MRRTSVIILSLVLVTLALTAAAPAAGASAPATWTYAFYANEDNDLAYTWAQFTKPFLMRIPANPQVNLVVVVDMPGKRGLALYEVGGGACTKVAVFPEKNMGSGATLKWFIEQIHTRYPSTYLGISILDHGYGWRGFSWDQTSNWDNITMPAMQNAIQGAGVPIDVLSFDACNMGDVEVAYQLALTRGGSPPAELVKYFVGSEETVDQDGIPYDIALTPLADNPALTPEDVAVDMVDAYQRYNLPRRCFGWVSLGAIDVAAVGAATTDLQDWVARMKLDLPAYKARFDADLAKCIYAWQSWHVDLAQLCDTLAADPLIADATLKTLSTAVANDCRGAMVGLWNGSYCVDFQGMTLWWGAVGDWSWYRGDYKSQVAFGKPAPTGMDWYAFLKSYNAMAAGTYSARSAAGPTATDQTVLASARHSAKTLPREPRFPPSTLVRASYGLADVTFIDALHGWAVGYNNYSSNAIILHTTDGGTTWKNLSSPSWYAYEFGAIKALDSTHFWAAGSERWADSIIAKSTDGVSWKVQPSHNYEYLMSVDFTSAGNGWVSGTNGALLHTTDGGAHWHAATTWDGADADDLWSVDFTDATHGWVVGGNASTLDGFVRRTTDGGQTWQAVLNVHGGVLYGLQAPSLVVGGDPVTGDSVAYYSTDGGATWFPSTGTPSDKCLYGVSSAPGGAVDWAVGTKGLVLRSINGGASWTAPAGAPGVTIDLAATSFTSDTNGWIVGDGETMLHTTDGGATWSPVIADAVWPSAHAVNAVVVKHGHAATLRFLIKDNMSATAAVTITIKGHGRTRTLRLGSQPCGTTQSTTWTCTLPAGHYEWTVSAVDESGNPSRLRPFSINTFTVK